MKTNMGAVDRIVRLLLAVIIANFYFIGAVGGGAATVLVIIAAVFVVTSFVGVCPAYSVIGFSTRKTQV